MRIIVNFKEIFMKNKVKRSASQLVLASIILLLIIFVYSARKTITVIIDGKEKKIVTYQKTVGEALKKEHIELGLKDKIDKDLKTNLSKNDTINIRKAVDVKLFADNKELSIKSAEQDVRSLLDAEKIVLKAEDKISPSLETKLSKGMDVKIIRVATKTISSSAPIAFNTIVKNDNDLLKSRKKVLQQGSTGEKQITTNVVYENGKEVSRKVIKEVVVKKPKDKIIAQGTLTPMYASRGTASFANSNVIRAKATAYWAVNGVGSTYTASGRKAVRNPNGYSTVAVDPRVIPLGTKLYIEGYGYAIAADEGTGVKGNFVDVFFDTYKEACNWGLKYVNVYIVK
ncbi:phosphatase-associated protein papQ [Clostridium tetanomorphum DSM 665]|nr:phosphatase-associated protein papQ [Clostridium tetanomorphum DSM 665]SQB92916.1 phosphatase-associated protein papQ [Clostridium tetanomorphum]